MTNKLSITFLIFILWPPPFLGFYLIKGSSVKLKL
jgi:hypothetical protein